MSLRVEPLAPTLHLTLCVVTSSLGRDQTVVIPQSWKGARPGWGLGGLERNHFPSIEYFKIYYL